MPFGHHVIQAKGVFALVAALACHCLYLMMQSEKYEEGDVGAEEPDELRVRRRHPKLKKKKHNFLCLHSN